MQKVNQVLKIVLQISKRKTDTKTKKINQLDYFKMIIQLDPLPQVLSIFLHVLTSVQGPQLIICMYVYMNVSK